MTFKTEIGFGKRRKVVIRDYLLSAKLDIPLSEPTYLLKDL
jgi:hypothetical protein